MKLIQKIRNESFARAASQFMRYVCCFIMCFMTLSFILVCMGRQTFSLHTPTGTYERAIYAEDDPSPRARNFTVTAKDDIHVWTNENGQIDIRTRIGLSVMYAFQIIPLIFAYYFLSRVFANIHNGLIFTEKNADYLLYYGLLQFFAALFVPFIKLWLCRLISLVSGSRVDISTGQDMLNSVIPGIAFLVAAYIIRYGIHLQEEVDHTL